MLQICTACPQVARFTPRLVAVQGVRPDFDWKLTALAGGTLRNAASALLAFPGLHQTSNANFGSIKPTKGFRLLETEAGHAEVTSRGLHFVQHKVDCLSSDVLFSWFWMDFAHSAAGLR